MVESQLGPRRRETRKIRQLRYDAGSLALNLVCTVGRRGAEPVERLRGCPELTEWLRRHDLPLSGPVDEDLLASVRQLREALHKFLRAIADGEMPSQEAVRLINARARVRPPAMWIAYADGIPGPAVTARWERELGTDHVLALIARDGIAHLSDHTRRHQLSVCAAEDCRMLYLASSGGARRQWCSMSYCGNRAKAANHRARRQASSPVSAGH